MHVMQGLVWEQWRQSQRWVLGSSAFLLFMMLFTFAFHGWLDRMFNRDLFLLDKVSLGVGITAVGLLFINERIADVSLYFPKRLFALPCRTMPILLSQLLFRSGVAVVLGLLLTLYQRQIGINATLVHGPTAFLLGLVGGIQATLLLATLLGAWRAAAIAVAGGSIAFAFYLALFDVLKFSMNNAMFITCVTIAALGWSISLVIAPIVRQNASGVGSPAVSERLSRSLTRSMPRPVLVQWDFGSPAWAHCWFEWRRVLRWLPAAVIAGAVIALLPTMLLQHAPLGTMVYVACYLCAMLAAAGCSYFLHRLSASDRRFLLAHPRGEQALIDGKLLSAAMATLTASALTIFLWGFAYLLSPILSGHREPDLGDLAPGFIGLTAAIWITLAAGPVYLAGFCVVGAYAIFARAIWDLSAFAGIGVEFRVLFVLVLLPIMLFVGAGLACRRRTIPYPWELAIAAAPLAWFVSVEWSIFSNTIFGLSANFWLSVTFPGLALLGGLVYLYRIGFITKSRANAITITYLILLSGAVFLHDLFFQSHHGILSDMLLWMTACVGGLACLPITLRLQRYR